MLHLEFPNISHKSEYLAMLEELKDWGEEKAPGALFRGKDYEEFLQITQDDTTKEKNQGVPATLFFIMNNGRTVGGIQIRHSIDRPNLREFGGHIGYGIRPPERRKGYATEALRLGLIEARKLGLTRVMLGCFDDNIGSKKSIEKNGGIFERCTTAYQGKNSNIYWIDC